MILWEIWYDYPPLYCDRSYRLYAPSRESAIECARQILEEEHGKVCIYHCVQI